MNSIAITDGVQGAGRRLLAVAGGFYCTHLCWIAIYFTYASFQNRHRVYGNDLPFDPQLWVEKFMQKALWFPIPVSFAVGLGTALILCLWSDRTIGRFPRLITLGLGGVSYAMLNGFLLLARPGALITFPVLTNWPLVVDAAILVLLPVGVAFALFRKLERSFFCCSAFIAMHCGLICMQHDLGRRVWQAGIASLPEGESRVLIMAMDAARLDDVQEQLPPEVSARVVRGISHFGSTRKQWRLLLTGDETQVAQSFFVPTVAELANRTLPHFIPQLARQRGLKTAFLIDDPQTLSRTTLGVDFDSCYMPHEGFFDAILADTTMFPVCAWLLNILGPVEGLNAWSDEDAFLRDVQRVLRKNHIVFAHTVRLQKGIYNVDELRAFGGECWLLMRPREFALVSEKTKGTGRELDARAVYRRKLDCLLSKIAPWLDQVCSTDPVSAVLTSDHGQEFVSIPETTSHYTGLHGWSIGPETVWIPFLGSGKTRVVGHPDGNLTWLSLHNAIVEWMGDRAELVLRREGSPIEFSSHYIAATHLTGWAQDAVPRDIVTMAQIIHALQVKPALGAVLDERFVAQPHRCSTGAVTGSILKATNPTENGGTENTEWDLYHLRNKSTVSSGLGGKSL